jgi:hypothetical protein
MKISGGIKPRKLSEAKKIENIVKSLKLVVI